MCTNECGFRRRTGRSCLRARSTWWSRRWRERVMSERRRGRERGGSSNQEQLAHRFSPRQSLVDRLDEHARRPGPGGRAVAPVEVQRRTRRLDLIERPALLLEIADPIANHHQHVAVGRDVGGVRQPAAPGDDPRAALRSILGDRQIEDVVEAVDHALDRAALGGVDERIADRRTGCRRQSPPSDGRTRSCRRRCWRPWRDRGSPARRSRIRQLVEVVEERVRRQGARERPGPCRRPCSSR